MTNEEIKMKSKRPIHGAYFHGEDWYICPTCNKSFEFWDTQFNRGFKETDVERVYQHECGEYLYIP